MTAPVPDEAVRLVDTYGHAMLDRGQEGEYGDETGEYLAEANKDRAALLAYIAGVVKERDSLIEGNAAAMEAMLLQHKYESAALRAELEAARAALEQACKALRTVGDDYPGSSCHEWCYGQADSCERRAKGIAGADNVNL